MKRLTALRGFIALAAIATAGCATQAPAPEVATIPQGLSGALCTTQAGSRLPPPKHGCQAGPGHVYSAEDLEMAGRAPLDDALHRMLPP